MRLVLQVVGLALMVFLFWVAYDINQQFRAATLLRAREVVAREQCLEEYAYEPPQEVVVATGTPPEVLSTTTIGEYAPVLDAEEYP